MKRYLPETYRAEPVDHSRRRFVQGVAAWGVLAGLGLAPKATWAVNQAGPPRTLSGTDFDLVIGETPVNFTGAPRFATAVNGQVPGPLLRWREGDTITLQVRNTLPVSTSIHWHGIILPYQMDGVPGLAFPGIAPGETFTYRFEVRQHGTYWYHSHSCFQEQTGLYGPLVIESLVPQPFGYDRDYVVMLSDWTDEDPHRVYAHLKEMDGYYNYNKPTLGDLVHQARKEGIASALRERAMWDRMRMSPRDLLDVSGATYTYLMNGTPPAGNWTGLFQRGERVRLRFINGSAMSYFDVHISGLKMTVIAADGQHVHPVTVDEFRIATAETLDVIIQPDDDVHTIFAQAMDRSGYTRGTLATRAGLEGEVPPLDPVPTLTMADAGMVMDMGGHAMTGVTMAGMNHGAARTTMTVKQHPATEHGPGSAMRAEVVSSRLDQPGAGLRHNGRRVLTYADLRGIDGWLDPRDPGRTIELHLTGNMERYMWSFNGVKFSDAEPLRFKHGERLRIVLINDTMMDHPIHLHGMWSELENPDGRFQARKHTLNVMPGHAVSYRVLADALGRWAYHCHLLYHMEAGMFREVRVS
jgi:CopA family copper-resistance protein